MPSERITAKRAALRGRIVAAALEAFAARGFEATTTADIADRLQMTGPALYHYFRTKDELLFACIEQVLQSLLEALAAAAEGGGTAAERMARVVRAQVGMELRNGSAAPLVNAHLYGPQYLMDMLGAEQRESLRVHQRSLVQVYRGLIDEGVAGGEFRVPGSAVAAFNVLAIVQYSGVWYRPRKGRRMDDLAEAQVAAVLQLLGAVPPSSSANALSQPPSPRKARA
jgi:AcrR family transcriptional regulator